MSFLRKLFGAKPPPPDEGIYFYVRCNNCGRIVRVRVNRQNDLQPDWDTGGYTLSKEMMDDKCFRLMRAEVTFDANYTILSQEAQGGTFVPAADYEAQQEARRAAAAAPPPQPPSPAANEEETP
ncbi:MAG: hypothetical protein U0768_01295 [Anaerolineae bacterium]